MRPNVLSTISLFRQMSLSVLNRNIFFLSNNFEERNLQKTFFTRFFLLEFQGFYMTKSEAFPSLLFCSALETFLSTVWITLGSNCITLNLTAP